MSYPNYGGCGCPPEPCVTWGSVLVPPVAYTRACGPVCVYEDLEELREETILVHNRVVMLLGRDSAFDGFGHVYVYRASTTEDDDGVNFIRPNAVPVTALGGWKLFL